MKKLFVFLAATIFISSGMVQAQTTLQFNSFDLEKGLVISDGVQYTMAAFTIKTKKDHAVVVDGVQINGKKAKFASVRQFGNKTLYVVAIPRNVKTKVGETFDLSIFFSYPGDQIKAIMLGTTDDEGDGGPGNSTDPTVIVIKYP